jgi:hypothetical protein
LSFFSSTQNIQQNIIMDNKNTAEMSYKYA